MSVSRCADCTRTDVKCCITCSRNGATCGVWHHCGKDCEGYEPRIKTWGDKIRSMNDEELAEFLEKVETYAYNDRSIAEDEQYHVMDMLQWLKSEVKE